MISDIVATMFSSAFMDEVVKPQQLYSHRTMKAVLTRLAHVSIMRLNPGSMDRVCGPQRLKSCVVFFSLARKLNVSQEKILI